MKNIYFTPVNEWKQIGKKFNWYTATVFTLEFENEPYTGGVEMRLIILGLGGTLRYNYDFENSPTGKRVEEWTGKLPENFGKMKFEESIEEFEKSIEELDEKIEEILK